MRTDIDERKEEIIGLLESGYTRLEICRILRCKYDTLKSRLDKWGCDIKNPGAKGRPQGGNLNYVPVVEYLHNDKNGKHCISSVLKKKLWREGLKDKKCEQCGIVDWLGSFKHLELDHINSDRFDNRLENLQILCANCHAVKSNGSGAAKGMYN